MSQLVCTSFISSIHVLSHDPIHMLNHLFKGGLDIHNIMHVINYDLPSAQYGGIEEYTHRIGKHL